MTSSPGCQPQARWPSGARPAGDPVRPGGDPVVAGSDPPARTAAPPGGPRRYRLVPPPRGRRPRPAPRWAGPGRQPGLDSCTRRPWPTSYWGKASGHRLIRRLPGEHGLPEGLAELIDEPARQLIVAEAGRPPVAGSTGRDPHHRAALVGPVRPLVGGEGAGRHRAGPRSRGTRNRCEPAGPTGPSNPIVTTDHRRRRDLRRRPSRPSRLRSNAAAVAAGVATTAPSKGVGSGDDGDLTVRARRRPCRPASRHEAGAVILQPLDMAADQLAQAVAEGGEDRTVRRRAGGLPEPEQKAARPFRGRHDHGGHLGRPERRRRAGVNAADERIDQTVGDLGAEAGPATSSRTVSVAGGRPRGSTRSRAARAIPAGERIRLRSTPPSWRGTPSTSPAGMGRSRPPSHSSARPTAGLTRSASTPTSWHSRRASGVRVMKASGPSSTRRPVELGREDLASEPVRLEDGHLGLPSQFPGGRQAGDAAPDHGHSHAVGTSLVHQFDQPGQGVRDRSAAAPRGRG